MKTAPPTPLALAALLLAAAALGTAAPADQAARPNVLFLFTSDNGLAVGRHGLMGKQNVYDHSVHVPFIVAGPGIPRGEMRDQLCYIYDIYPTLCERAGLQTPDTVQFKSLNAVIKDPAAGHRDHLYFAFMSWQRAVRDG